MVLEKSGFDVSCYLTMLKFRRNEFAIKFEQAKQAEDFRAAFAIQEEKETTINKLLSEVNLPVAILEDVPLLQSRYQVPVELLEKVTSSTDIFAQRRIVEEKINSYQLECLKKAEQIIGKL